MTISSGILLPGLFLSQENSLNVFDFDKTIYKHDSTTDLVFYTLRKHPSTIRFLPAAGFTFLLYAVKIWTLTQTKTVLFKMFRNIPDIDRYAEEFWDTHEQFIKSWYKTVHCEDDVVVSAGPDFLIKPICRRLGIRNVICSRIDPSNMQFIGINCDRAEKVRRFRETFPDAVADNFFSDSHTDHAFAVFAKQAYLVRGEELFPWPWVK